MGNGSTNSGIYGTFGVVFNDCKNGKLGGATSRIGRNFATKFIAKSRWIERVESLNDSIKSNCDSAVSKNICVKWIASAFTSLAKTVRGESSLRDSATAESWQSIVKIIRTKCDTASRSASWCIKRGAKEAGVPPLFLCKKRNQARLSPKSEKRSFFRSAFASHQPLARRVGERGGGAALFAKKWDSVNHKMAIESRRSKMVESLNDSIKSNCDSAVSKNICVKWIASAFTSLAKTVRGGGQNRPNTVIARFCESGIWRLWIPAPLFAMSAFGVELNTLCQSNSCKISTPQSEVTNRSEFSYNTDIAIETQITSFINYSTINLGNHNINVNSQNNNLTNLINYGTILTTNEGGKVSLKSYSSGHFHNVYNYGFISGGLLMEQQGKDTIFLTNYGTMGGVNVNGGNTTTTVTVNNYNLIKLYDNKQFHAINKLVIENYAIKIEQNSQTFNAALFTDTTDNTGAKKPNTSHLYASETNSVTFSDENSRLILSAGGDFEFGQDYLTNKLILSRKKDAQQADENHIDAFRLTTKDNYLELSTTPTHFKLNVNGAMSEVALTHKANIKSINLMTLQSNDIIFKRYSFAKTSAKSPAKKRLRTAQIAESIAENDTFFYKNGADSAGGIGDSRGDSNNYGDSAIFLADARTERVRKARNLNTRNAPNRSTTQRNSLSIKQPSTQTSTATPISDKYYFAFVPFVAYNSLGEQNRYNLSGLEYGLVASFSGSINSANALGLHFAFSYDRYADSGDDRHFKDFYIKSFNFNAGLNYKLDLPLLMYIKARIDAFYFMNEFGGVPYYYNLGANPNTLGFGGSVYYGKDFDFGDGGVVSLEAGVDYKGLKLLKELKIIDEFQSKNDTHKAQIYHIPYLELSLGYEKYFNFGLGVSARVGMRGNPAFNALKNTLVIYDTATNSDRSYDFILDSDKIIGYANLGISYKVLDMMDFSVNYSGNFGDKSMSHAGNFAFKLWW